MILFSCYKGFLYNGLTIRLIKTYSNSKLYSIKYLQIWQIWIIITIIATSIIATYTTKLDTAGYCTASHPIWTLAIFAMNDVCICCMNIILFTYPLCETTKILSKMDNNDDSILYLIHKHSLLSSIAVGSSVIFLGMIGVTHAGLFWLSMDQIVTTTSMVLLFKQNDKIFDWCCGCCLCKYRKSKILQIDNKSNNNCNISAAEKAEKVTPTTHNINDKLPTLSKMEIVQSNSVFTLDSV